MLLLNGLVLQITNGKEVKNRETGEIRHDPVVQIQHKTTSSPDALIIIDNIKLKDPQQVAAFRSIVGKQMNVPVRTWSTETGEGFWLEKGVLPTVQSERPAA
jgi:hypothetical protein